MRIVLPAALPAIITGLLLAIARVTGETAPLLFTAFGSQFWEINPTQPMARPLQVFTYAISPYQSWHVQAWGGALLLILAVFVLNVLGAWLVLAQATADGTVSAEPLRRAPLSVDDLSAYYGGRRRWPTYDGVSAPTR